jgi:hypothetical protein
MNTFETVVTVALVVIAARQLVGFWEVYYGYRNGKKSDSRYEAESAANIEQMNQIVATAKANEELIRKQIAMNEYHMTTQHPGVVWDKHEGKQ